MSQLALPGCRLMRFRGTQPAAVDIELKVVTVLPRISPSYQRKRSSILSVPCEESFSMIISPESL